MDFTSIYQRILPLWPSKIIVSDGYEVDPQNEATPGTSPSGGKKYYFPTLDQAWCNAEDQIDPKTDTWGDMMVWTMFQEFHKCAKELLEAGHTVLVPENISIRTLENRYRSNLNTEGWEIERDTYEGL